MKKPERPTASRKPRQSREGPEREFVFAALGGVGEIGMNLYVYGFGPPSKKEWLIVDCGVAFAGPDLPGVDLIMADIAFLKEERRRIVGLAVTHAHEDHIGAIADLWPQLGCPVFATPFAAALLETKRLSEPGAPKVPIKIVSQGATVTLGPFTVEWTPVAHSIPEANALAITTALGTAIHTGDWKIDPDPVVGRKTDEARFRALGKAGVVALIGDSTNAIRAGHSPSEKDVAIELDRIIAGAKNRVAVTTFASNVARMRSVAEAAARAGRQVVLVGRALERVAGIAREQGMFEGLPPFVGAESYGYLPREKVVALVTGSQGEPRAALARIATDDHPEVTLASGDLVIFSSRTIPGNEKVVGAIMNGLVRQGIEILTDRDALVHASGHPRRGELEEMIAWTQPKALIPVHGEAVHLADHATLARKCGVKEVVLGANGDLIRLAPGPAEIVDSLPAGRLFKDGSILVSEMDRVVPERRKLAFAGVVSVAFAIDERGALAGDVELELAGIPDVDGRGEDLADLVVDVVAETVETLPKARRRDPEAVRESVTKAIRGVLNGRWGKKPLCHVLVVTV